MGSHLLMEFIPNPVAIDYRSNKHILLSLKSENSTNPRPYRNPQFIGVYLQAKETINVHGGIRGHKSKDSNKNAN